MRKMYRWEVKDSNNNCVTIVERSKSAAKRAFKQMAPFPNSKIVSIERKAEAPYGPSAIVKKRPVFKPTEPKKLSCEVPGPNDPCPCGSDRKSKRCCLQKLRAKAMAGQ